GKILTGFHMIRALALGADLCASARGMMLALGCIQALRCNTDHCPTGITTQNPALVHGLHVGRKSERVARFHHNTVRGCLELLGAMGVRDPGMLRPDQIFRRVDDLRVRHFGELYEFLRPGQLLAKDGVPESLRVSWLAAHPEQWGDVPGGPHPGGST
ncbi:MAG: glutamate synthase-related protein, partial [Acidobacteriota bacterium]